MSAQVNVAKIKIRRGLDSERTQVILDSGELGFTTDTQRLYIGDGVTTGGLPAANRYAGSFSSVSNVTEIEEGDFVIINNVFYIYTGGGKGNIANYINFSNVAVDDVTIGYNGSNQLYVKSIANVLAASVDTTKGIYKTTGDKIAAKVDNASTEFDGSGNIVVKNINSTQHGSLAGGSLHSAATTTVNGFMSSSDKTKLDASPNWSLSALTNTQTQLVVNSINNYTGGSISNVTALTSFSIKTGNSTQQTVNSNYFLNQQNDYNATLQPGSITYTSLPSSKISNPGELAQWTINTSSIASFNDNAFILVGGDGRQYGFYYNASSLYLAPNISWIEVNLQNQSSLMSAISSVESSGDYGYRVFDVYETTTANTFVVKSLYPNYCNYYNNINSSTGITITQDSNGKQAAALTNKLVCDTTVSSNLPLSGRPTILTITVVGGLDGTGVNSNNNNRYITIYNNNYSKNVFYFYNSSIPTGTPSVNIDSNYPGVIGSLYQIPYSTSDTTETLINSLSSTLDTAGFNIVSKTSTSVTFATGGNGYCLDAYTNYDNTTVIASIAKGGDYISSVGANNGLPQLYRLTQAGMGIITSVGTPGIQYIKLPGVPAISYTTESGTQNSVALIKY